MRHELNALEILERCKDCVPVNTIVSEAIAAHRIAFARYEQAVDDESIRKIAFYSLHAIVMASASEGDCRAQLDYLSEVPLTAWESRSDFSAQNYRDETLASIARRIRLSCSCRHPPRSRRVPSAASSFKALATLIPFIGYPLVAVFRRLFF